MNVKYVILIENIMHSHLFKKEFQTHCILEQINFIKNWGLNSIKRHVPMN